jgi:20S proteasome subunit beta 7
MTQTPVIQGSSVVALKYNGGVMMMVDCQLTFGSGLAKFFKAQRFTAVNQQTLFTCSGELSDYQ